ncbi:MAG: 4-(cytidine 5'-diphospho)-2-C-methyl-D-erythritol kinase [Paludibacteraceae bacterium]|nr:4-(cytidine 5'-diphospho)-2-C-methyl-D-erythritol kinase [Paludibacteraceae bacterium]
MLLYPNCKINLGLRVIRRREDGYHDLETIFVPIYGLHDELEVTVNGECAKEGNGCSFIQEGIAVDCAVEDNLIVKCYRLMRAKYPQIGSVSIRFRKHIPFGAGLGGGSSDAAHMAIALNELYHLGLSHEQLASEVRPLGADCPFFVYNVPCYAEGIGDQLTPIPLDMNGWRIVLVKPDEGVSTREAYSGIIRHPEAAGQMKAMLFGQEGMRSGEIIGSHQELFINDFEQTVFPLHPSIAQIKERLLEAGALYASMSGSGSTVFGLFENNPESRANAKLRLFEQEFASMILLDDTFGEWQS